MSLLEYGFTKKILDNELTPNERKMESPSSSKEVDTKHKNVEKMSPSDCLKSSEKCTTPKISNCFPKKTFKSKSSPVFVNVVSSKPRPIKEVTLSNGNLDDKLKKLTHSISNEISKKSSEKKRSDSPVFIEKLCGTPKSSEKKRRPSTSSPDSPYEKKKKDSPGFKSTPSQNDRISFSTPYDTSLPQHRVKVIMKSSPDVDAVPQESLYLVTKATELFVKYLVSESFHESKNKIVDYDGLARVIHSHERFDFLQETVPKKITWAECQKLRSKRTNDC